MNVNKNGNLVILWNEPNNLITYDENGNILFIYKDIFDYNNKIIDFCFDETNSLYALSDNDNKVIIYNKYGNYKNHFSINKLLVDEKKEKFQKISFKDDGETFILLDSRAVIHFYKNPLKKINYIPEILF